MPSLPSPATKRQPGLDTLRALAVALVFLYHYQVFVSHAPTFGWLGNMTQYELFKDIETMDADARKAGGDLLTHWRHLTTSDHVYFPHESIGEDHAVHAYFNP